MPASDKSLPIPARLRLPSHSHGPTAAAVTGHTGQLCWASPGTPQLARLKESSLSTLPKSTGSSWIPNPPATALVNGPLLDLSAVPAHWKHTGHLLDLLLLTPRSIYLQLSDPGSTRKRFNQGPARAILDSPEEPFSIFLEIALLLEPFSPFGTVPAASEITRE